jgi:dsRNA-specific ribonuclease
MRTINSALVMLQNVLPRLQHFCACLPTREFVDSRPEFRTWNEAAPGARGCWSAEVVLPNAIDAEIRRTSSLETWKTEKAAKKDAAFEAFVKLYKHGLVDDHLMPLVKGEFQNEQEVQKRQPKVEVEERKDIWESLDQKWNEGGNLYVSTLEVTFSTRETVGINLILPVELPEMEPLRLFWYRDETATATFGRSRRIGYDPKLIDRGKRAAYRLFKTIFSLRMDEDRQDFSYLFVPCEGECWDLIPEVQVNALEAITNNRSVDIGLIRGQNDVPYIFRRLRTDLAITEAEDFKGQQTQTQCTLDNVRRDQPLLEVTQLSKQRDFLHLEAGRRKETKTLFLLPEFVTVDTLPWKYSQLALLLPFLINRVEKALLAADLRQNLGFQELPNTLMVHALTASSARDPVDYQRLEFLGDSILKVLASVALMDEFPLYHEGYLTAAKDHIVSNNTSSKAAAKLHLSRWINTASFTAAKWRPRYAGPSTKPASKLQLSTKILADVVEAIIGVSYLTGGYEGATKCCATFGLGTEWRPLKERVKGLQAKAAENDARHERNYPHYFDELETLLGYSFRNRVLLLEATTHLSYGAADSLSTSYQRLEFLGDAVLDTIIVNTLYHFPGVNLSHINMHHLKSCCVNAHLLAFLCAGATTEVERMEPHPTGETPLQPVRRTVSLYRFLRANNPGLQEAQRKFMRRYERYKDEIFAQLKTPGRPPWKDAAPPEYPWEDLQKLDAPKHLSDIIESIIGAIWIDSDGDFEVVKRFLERLGVIEILERLVTGDFVVNHPLSRFGIKAAGDGKMGVVKYECELEEGRSTYWCEVRINDDPIARVEGCVSRQHARTVAAREGLRVLEAREEAERRKKAAEEEVRKDEMEKKEEEEEKEEEEIEGKAKAPEEVEEPVGLSLRGGDRTGEEDEDADEEVLPLSFLLGYTYGLV